MFPPIFETINIAPVRALLKQGNGPLRFYLFGMAPEKKHYPYAVWRQQGGSPENYLGNVPDIDQYTTQVDVYAAEGQTDIARIVAEALRDAIEPHAHIIAWLGDDTDPQTRSATFRFLVDWWTGR